VGNAVVIRRALREASLPDQIASLLSETVFGRIVVALDEEMDGLSADAFDWRLARIYDQLAVGEAVRAEDRRYVLALAWAHRAVLPPELVVYAAIGGGVCGLDEAGSGL
jgi:hypothetical protein